MHAKSLLLASLLLAATTASANIIKVYRTTHSPEMEQPSFTYSDADLVGTFKSNMLDFTNWHPYGLEHFAVEITGFVHSNAPTDAFFIGAVDSNGWYKFEIGNWAYETYFAPDPNGGPIVEHTSYFVGELEYSPGKSPFRLTYQTSPYNQTLNWGTPTTGPTFRSLLPYDGWGGDDRAHGYRVTLVVPDEASTGVLLAASVLGLVASSRRQRRAPART